MVNCYLDPLLATYRSCSCGCVASCRPQQWVMQRARCDRDGRGWVRSSNSSACMLSARLARMRRCVRVCATTSCHVSSIGFKTLEIASAHGSRACAFRRGRCVTHLSGSRHTSGPCTRDIRSGGKRNFGAMGIVWFHSTSRRVPDRWL